MLLNGAQSLPLVLRQLRVPHVHDEDEAVTVGVLPNLVLEGVVEDEDFTLLPFPGLVGAADPAAMWGDDEAEMHPQSAVSGTSVRPHMSTWLHHRELNLSSLAACSFRISLQQ